MTWPCVRVSDPGSTGKMDGSNLRFFWWRVYNTWILSCLAFHCRQILIQSATHSSVTCIFSPLIGRNKWMLPSCNVLTLQCDLAWHLSQTIILKYCEESIIVTFYVCWNKKPQCTCIYRVTQSAALCTQMSAVLCFCFRTHMTCATRKQTLRPRPSFFWYDTDF